VSDVDTGRGAGVRFEIDYSNGNRWFMGLLGTGPRFSDVVLDDGHLRIRMGWAFRAHIPLVNVRRVTATERPFIGWGVHGWRGRWLVNGSVQGIAAVEIDPPVRAWTLGFPLRLRTVFVSLADRERFLRALTPIIQGVVEPVVEPPDPAPRAE
jgi:hypothetical protein